MLILSHTYTRYKYINKVAKMIIDGNLETLNINGSFDMKDSNGVPFFSVSRNKFMPDKVFITSPSTNTEYLGEIVHNINKEEFVVYEDDAEILRIKHTNALGIPKIDISSPFGDFTTKLAIRKRSLVLLDGQKEVLAFSGTPSDYKLNIDDNCNTFYVMTVAYGITSLLNIEN